VPAVLQACDTKSKLRNMSEQISIFDIEVSNSSRFTDELFFNYFLCGQELEVAKQLTLRTGDIYTRYKVQLPPDCLMRPQSVLCSFIWCIVIMSICSL